MGWKIQNFAQNKNDEHENTGDFARKSAPYTRSLPLQSHLAIDYLWFSFASSRFLLFALQCQNENDAYSRNYCGIIHLVWAWNQYAHGIKAYNSDKRNRFLWKRITIQFHRCIPMELRRHKHSVNPINIDPIFIYALEQYYYFWIFHCHFTSQQTKWQPIRNFRIHFVPLFVSRTLHLRIRCSQCKHCCKCIWCHSRIHAKCDTVWCSFDVLR